MNQYKGPQTVSKRTTGAVMRLLARAGKPMTITQLADITGKSYNTVKQALHLGGAVKVEGTYPAVFTVAALYEAERIIGNSTDTVRVPFAELDEAVARWNKSRSVFTKNLGAVEIAPEADPDKLYEQFTQAAQVLASLAYAIDKVRNGPDWYTELEGLTHEGH